MPNRKRGSVKVPKGMVRVGQVIFVGRNAVAVDLSYPEVEVAASKSGRILAVPLYAQPPKRKEKRGGKRG